MDDLLWILTDRQIQATFICVKSLSESIEASRRQTMSMQRSNSEVSIMSGKDKKIIGQNFLIGVKNLKPGSTKFKKDFMCRAISPR